jgi:hypothetical protein
LAQCGVASRSLGITKRRVWRLALRQNGLRRSDPGTVNRP